MYLLKLILHSLHVCRNTLNSKSSPTPYGITDSSLEYLSGKSGENDPPNVSGGAFRNSTRKNIEDLKTGYDDLFEYDKSFLRVAGEYTNVPIGLGTDNLFGEGNFRAIAQTKVTPRR